MAKDLSAPLIRTARLLDLVPYLNSHQGISIEELAREFSVTPMQISSDLTTLWMCGLPGYTPLELMDLEFESGYVTIRNAETLKKPRSISFDEGLALLLGLELLQQAISSQREDLLTEIGKLSDRLSEKIGVPRLIKSSQDVSPEVFLPLLSAIDSFEDLEISYHALYSDEITKRLISPLAIYQENGSSYLRAYCFKAKDIRIFRIDRILTLINMGKTEKVDSQERKETKTKHGFASEAVTYSVKIRALTRDVVERFNLDKQIEIIGRDVGKMVELTSFSREWIQRAVLATGSNVELMTPSYLREEIAISAQRLLDRYTQSRSL